MYVNVEKLLIRFLTKHECHILYTYRLCELCVMYYVTLRSRHQRF